MYIYGPRLQCRGSGWCSGWIDAGVDNNRAPTEDVAIDRFDTDDR